MNKNAIAWAEIPVTDFERAKAFYEAILDTTLILMDMGPGGKMGMFPTPVGGVGGAIIQSEDRSVTGPAGVRLYLDAGPDLNAILNRVEAAGGKVHFQKTLISPEMGYFAFLVDTEGTAIGLWSLN